MYTLWFCRTVVQLREGVQFCFEMYYWIYDIIIFYKNKHNFVNIITNVSNNVRG